MKILQYFSKEDLHSIAIAFPNWRPLIEEKFLRYYLIPNLQGIFNSPNYHGTFSDSLANTILQNKRPGTYLFRNLGSAIYNRRQILTLSIVTTKGEIRHDDAIVVNNLENGDKEHPDFVFYHKTSLKHFHKNHPNSCFIKEYLKNPIFRTMPFPLKTLSLAAVADQIEFENIENLNIPLSLKKLLRGFSTLEMPAGKKLFCDSCLPDLVCCLCNGVHGPKYVKPLL